MRLQHIQNKVEELHKLLTTQVESYFFAIENLNKIVFPGRSIYLDNSLPLDFKGRTYHVLEINKAGLISLTDDQKNPRSKNWRNELDIYQLLKLSEELEYIKGAGLLKIWKK